MVFFSLRRIGCVRIYLNRQTSACGRTPAWKIKLIFFLFVEYILHSGQYFAHTFPSNCVVFNIIVLFYRRSNRIHVLNQIESTRITITIILIDNEVFLHLTHLSSQHHHVVSHHHHHYYYNNRPSCSERHAWILLRCVIYLPRYSYRWRAFLYKKRCWYFFVAIIKLYPHLYTNREDSHSVEKIDTTKSVCNFHTIAKKIAK